MRGRNWTCLLLLTLGLAGGGSMKAAPALACGFGEAPDDCGETPEEAARYMLNRVVAAVQTDKARALDEFSRGEAGFRSVDSYVFCVGPDGVMTAHPSAILRGQDVRSLHDKTGNYFIATMMKTAEPGTISQIHYLFPRPGAVTASPKTTFYTKAGDQVCGVGVYDPDDTAASGETLDQRLARLRQRLTAGMPEALGADWTEYQRTLDEQKAGDEQTLARAREQLRAAADTLALAAGPAPTH